MECDLVCSQSLKVWALSILGPRGTGVAVGRVCVGSVGGAIPSVREPVPQHGAKGVVLLCKYDCLVANWPHQWNHRNNTPLRPVFTCVYLSSVTQPLTHCCPTARLHLTCLRITVNRSRETKKVG